MDSTQPLLLPIGHDMGVRHGGDGNRYQQVRAGMDLVELTGPEYLVWLLAHGINAADRPTRSSVTVAAEQLEIPRDTTAAIIDRMVADGLLAAVDPVAGSAVPFAERHQLVPLLMGLGQDEDSLPTIGLFGQPLAAVSGAVYDVWVWAHLTPHLWIACQDAAEVARRAGVTEPAETEADGVLAGILQAVHGLLSVRAAYLDRRGLV
ncbi:hypothetical protein ACFVWG_08135 [Kribbella sp. NPDC058245]|uniref:hypothetical protein n=1 Tax=Kribbella sp. NPDC058245 TaxID=3346399 RepID=UPI0036E09481